MLSFVLPQRLIANYITVFLGIDKLMYEVNLDTWLDIIDWKSLIVFSQDANIISTHLSIKRLFRALRILKSCLLKQNIYHLNTEARKD